MSYEYAVQFDSEIEARTAFREIATAIRLIGLVNVVSSTDDRTLLRWSDEPVRATWPEDIAVLLAETAIVVQLFTGSRVAMGALLDELSKVINDCVPGQFLFSEI